MIGMHRKRCFTEKFYTTWYQGTTVRSAGSHALGLK